MEKIEQRIQALEAILKERHMISIRDLSALLKVSEMTVRRDLSLLKNHPHIKNIRGMIVYEDNSLSNSYNILNASDIHISEKMKIGAAAAALIQEDDVIMLDIGSTTEFVARSLNPDLRATIICTSSNALSTLTLDNYLKIYCTGGYFHSDTQLLESSESLSFLKNTRANKLFASAAGIHRHLGVTCANSYELATKKALIESSAERILLVDSSKFGCVQSTYLSDISCYHKIITDSHISPEWSDYLTKCNIKLIIV